MFVADVEMFFVEIVWPDRFSKRKSVQFVDLKYLIWNLRVWSEFHGLQLKSTKENEIEMIFWKSRKN